MSEHLDELLARREAESAQVIEVDEAQVKLVIFRLGEECFALRGAQVREILPAGEIFYVPGCPDSLVGVINLRGDVESVVQLDRLLQRSGARDNGVRDSARPGFILLLQASAMRTGLLVDEVEDVIDVVESALQPPLATLPSPLDQWVDASLVWRDQGIPCLDGERLLRDYRARLGQA
ncbi:MAG: chemotaxis protein CheW [Gammaproteobacteria bacterium]|nr:chemotaxis protein CheW [Gammaproteobacteria bacterium]